jgi:uncharacterized protein (TIGR04255 family)
MVFNLVRVPRKITPCPIVEAVAEVCFESKLPAEIIFGSVFGKFRSEFPEIEKLPILDLPQSIRDNDPNLKFLAYYRLKNKNFILQIGPKCFSVICPKEYKGWDVYSSQIVKAFGELKELNIIEKPVRSGLRYVSFFENIDIFQKSKLIMALSEKSLVGFSNVLRTEFDDEGFRCILQLGTDALINNVKGSVIDIDLVCVNSQEIEKDFLAVMKKAHEIEKNIFFNILKDDYLKEFKPEY